MRAFRSAWNAMSRSNQAYTKGLAALMVVILMVIASMILHQVGSPSARWCEINAYIDCTQYGDVQIVGATCLGVATAALLAALFFACAFIRLHNRESKG